MPLWQQKCHLKPWSPCTIKLCQHICCFFFVFIPLLLFIWYLKRTREPTTTSFAAITAPKAPYSPDQFRSIAQAPAKQPHPRVPRQHNVFFTQQKVGATTTSRPLSSPTSPRCVSIDRPHPRIVAHFTNQTAFPRRLSTPNHQPPLPPLPPLPPKPPQQPWPPRGTPPPGQLANKNCKSLRNSSKISSFFLSFLPYFARFSRRSQDTQFLPRFNSRFWHFHYFTPVAKPRFFQKS